MDQGTVILLFTRSVAEEARHKSLSGSRDFRRNLRLAQGLRLNAEQVIRQSGISYRIVDTAMQRGNSFGARLTNAIGKLFEEGFERVIAVGNDCPDLDAQVLRAAEARLSENEIVLGPDQRGGVYLLGLTARNFAPEALLSLPWQQSTLLLALQKQFGGEAAMLPLRRDLNTGADLRAWLGSRTAAKKLRGLLLSILFSTEKHKETPYTTWVSTHITGIQLLRGPPTTAR